MRTHRPTISIWSAFQSAYRLESGQPIQLVEWDERRAANGERIFTGTIEVNGVENSISGRGNGLISSVLGALEEAEGIRLDVQSYAEHAIGQGSNARAAAYVEATDADGRTHWGVGIDEDVATASVRAVLSAANAARG